MGLKGRTISVTLRTISVTLRTISVNCKVTRIERFPGGKRCSEALLVGEPLQHNLCCVYHCPLRLFCRMYRVMVDSSGFHEHIFVRLSYTSHQKIGTSRFEQAAQERYMSRPSRAYLSRGDTIDLKLKFVYNRANETDQYQSTSIISTMFNSTQRALCSNSECLT
jgi:hypothetical protein